MIRHILLLQLRDGATAADIASARDALGGLIGPIPGLLNYHWGVNIAPQERRDGYTHGFSMDFADKPSLDAYGPHPLHQAAVLKVRAAFERIAVFDFEL